MTTTLPAVGVPAETTTPIKPSEALRFGRLLVPARADHALVRLRKGEVIRACILGAIAVGSGQADEVDPQDGFWWPTDLDAAPRVVSPCACPPKTINWQLQRDDPLPGPRAWAKPRAYRVWAVLAHLSDKHWSSRLANGHDMWSTVRVVAWLESLGL